MKAIAEIEVHALGVGASQRDDVAEAVRILRASGLQLRVHSMGTEIAGELSRVLEAVRAVHDGLHERGAPRITSSLKLETRLDDDVELEGSALLIEASRPDTSEASAFADTLPGASRSEEVE